MSDSFAMPEAASTAASVTEAVNAVTHAPETIASLFDGGERLVYGTIYTAAFAITFPIALLIAAIPKGNVVYRGLTEGATDAMTRAERMLGPKSLL